MNKWVFLVAAAACLALVCNASPVKRSSAEGASSEDAAVKSSRQEVGETPAVVEAVVAAPAAPVVAAPAAPAGGDDDDDDDDDYDVGVGDDDDDDDDDDDEEEDDDDDEDYFERFFEDILGDDEDDDEPVGAGSTVQAVQGPLIGTAGGSGNAVPVAAVPVAAAPAPVAAPQAAAPVSENVVTTLEASVISQDSSEDEASYDDEEDEVTSSGAEEPSSEVEAGSFEEDDGRQPEQAQQVQQAAVAAPQPAATGPVEVAAATAEEEDDDDDDDEEDLGVGELADVEDDDDDDDEDDDEEEDDDDEDDDEEGESEDDDDDDDYDTDVASRARSLDMNGTGRVPASLYVSKYNRYVDSILGRIRKVLRKSFDPVNVRLHSSTKVNNNTKNKTGPKRPKANGSASAPSLERQLQEESLLKAQSQHQLSSTSEVQSSGPVTSQRNQERRKGGSGGGGRPHGGNNYQKPKNKNKVKGRPRARATLMGLSSIRRDGDVSVNLMSTHTSVRSNFLLGPLVLKVEKEFGRGETKDLRSASAVTEEMSGVMSLRVTPEGTATLHNIRVLQPKQVRVESTDDHDKTREFVWRRSSHIAHVVSRKLTAAARSMLGQQRNDPKQMEEGKSLFQVVSMDNSMPFEQLQRS